MNPTIVEDVRQTWRFAKLRGLDPRRTIRKFLRWELKRLNHEALQDVAQHDSCSRTLTLNWIVADESPFTFHQRYCLFLVDSLGSARKAAAYLGVDRTHLTDTLRDMLPLVGGTE